MAKNKGDDGLLHSLDIELADFRVLVECLEFVMDFGLFDEQGVEKYAPAQLNVLHQKIYKHEIKAELELGRKEYQKGILTADMFQEEPEDKWPEEGPVIGINGSYGRRLGFGG